MCLSFLRECVPGYSARGRLGLICLLACSSSWRVERNDLTLSDNSSRHASINNHHQGNTERKEHSRECFTSELNKDLNLLVKNLLQLRRVGVHVVVHLLSHLQENLLILKPPDRLLSAHIVWTSSLAIPFFSFGTEPYLSTNESENKPNADVNWNKKLYSAPDVPELLCFPVGLPKYITALPKRAILNTFQCKRSSCAF